MAPSGQKQRDYSLSNLFFSTSPKSSTPKIPPSLTSDKHRLYKSPNPSGDDQTTGSTSSMGTKGTGVRSSSSSDRGRSNNILKRPLLLRRSSRNSMSDTCSLSGSASVSAASYASAEEDAIATTSSICSSMKDLSSCSSFKDSSSHTSAKDHSSCASVQTTPAVVAVKKRSTPTDKDISIVSGGISNSEPDRELVDKEEKGEEELCESEESTVVKASSEDEDNDSSIRKHGMQSSTNSFATFGTHTITVSSGDDSYFFQKETVTFKSSVDDFSMSYSNHDDDTDYESFMLATKILDQFQEEEEYDAEESDIEDEDEHETDEVFCIPKEDSVELILLPPPAASTASLSDDSVTSAESSGEFEESDSDSSCTSSSSSCYGSLSSSSFSEESGAYIDMEDIGGYDTSSSVEFNTKAFSCFSDQGNAVTPSVYSNSNTSLMDDGSLIGLNGKEYRAPGTIEILRPKRTRRQSPPYTPPAGEYGMMPSQYELNPFPEQAQVATMSMFSDQGNTITLSVSSIDGDRRLQDPDLSSIDGPYYYDRDQAERPSARVLHVSPFSFSRNRLPPYSNYHEEEKQCQESYCTDEQEPPRLPEAPMRDEIQDYYDEEETVDSLVEGEIPRYINIWDQGCNGFPGDKATFSARCSGMKSYFCFSSRQDSFDADEFVY